MSTGSVRSPLVGKFGPVGFMGFYSFVAAVTFCWMIIEFGRAPFVETWTAPIAIAHLPAGIMPIALYFIVGAYTSKNPTMVGAQGRDWSSLEPVGVMAITRHPMAWGIGLWARSHMLTGGGLARLIFFGSIGALGFLGAWHQDKRKALQLGDAWPAYVAKTSFLPFGAVLSGRLRLRFADIGWWRIALALAIYGVVIVFHERIIGFNPLPL